ncbi:MAG: hypothetical protein PHE25_06150 [Candidatus Gracilibacteria bacterium]|nr:hypothetical protein [Candidatus Gracilibacteria bacterium]
MTTINLENNILTKYSLNILTIQNRRETKKGKLMDNLFQYMIKNSGVQKEDLALNVDELLYGNK